MISWKISVITFRFPLFQIFHMHVLDNALAKNTEKRQVHFGHSQNMAVLARQLQNVHTEKDRQISSVLQRVSIQEQALLKANKYYS